MDALDYLKSKRSLCDSYDDCIDCPFIKLHDNCAFAEMKHPEDVIRIIEDYKNNPNFLKVYENKYNFIKEYIKYHIIDHSSFREFIKRLPLKEEKIITDKSIYEEYIKSDNIIASTDTFNTLIDGFKYSCLHYLLLYEPIQNKFTYANFVNTKNFSYVDYTLDEIIKTIEEIEREK